MRIPFECKNNDIIPQFVSSTSPRHLGECHIRKQHMYVDTLFTFRSKCKQCVRVTQLTQNSIRCLLIWYSPRWRYRVTRRRQIVELSLFLLFFAHKKYSRSFVKLQLNPWCHMDYFNDVLATFLSLDRGNVLAVYERVRELSDFIKNIRIGVPKVLQVWNDARINN